MAEQDQSERLLNLVEKAQSGDEDAFEMLYNECYEPILRFFILRAPSVADAEDLAQQVFMRFYRNLHNWRNEGFSPLAYIFTVARSVMVDYWRKNKNRPIENSEEILPLLVDSSEQPDEQQISKEATERVVRAIGRLPENYQEVISFRLIKGLTNPEIAVIIGKSEVATRKLYSRGIQKLQMELEGGEL